MSLSRWKIMASALGLSVGGLAVFAGQQASEQWKRVPTDRHAGPPRMADDSSVSRYMARAEVPEIPPLPAIPEPLPTRQLEAPIRQASEFELIIPLGGGMPPAPTLPMSTFTLPEPMLTPVAIEVETGPVPRVKTPVAIELPPIDPPAKPIAKPQSSIVIAPPMVVPPIPPVVHAPTPPIVVQPVPSVETFPAPIVREPEAPFGRAMQTPSAPIVVLTPPPSVLPVAPPAPMPPSVATVPPVNKLKMTLRLGDGSPRFEIRNTTGEELLLKVYGDKIDLQQLADGAKASPLTGVTANGKVRFTGPGIEGTCDQLSILSGTGEVLLKGNIHLRTKLRSKAWSELVADKMIYQIGGNGLETATTPTSRIAPAGHLSPEAPAMR